MLCGQNKGRASNGMERSSARSESGPQRGKAGAERCIWAESACKHSLKLPCEARQPESTRSVPTNAIQAGAVPHREHIVCLTRKRRLSLHVQLMPAPAGPQAPRSVPCSAPVPAPLRRSGPTVHAARQCTPSYLCDEGMPLLLLLPEAGLAPAASHAHEQSSRAAHASLSKPQEHTCGCARAGPRQTWSRAPCAWVVRPWVGLWACREAPRSPRHPPAGRLSPPVARAAQARAVRCCCRCCPCWPHALGR